MAPRGGRTTAGAGRRRDDAGLLREAACVRVEQLGSEGVDRQAGSGLGGPVDRPEDAAAVRREGDDPVVGLVDVLQHHDERQDDGHDDALLDADEDDDRGRDEGHRELQCRTR